jgi:hypothetical protein
MLKPITLFLLMIFSVGCSTSSRQAEPIDAFLYACSTVIGEDRFSVNFHENNQISICNLGVDDLDCQYSLNIGKTYLRDTPDLNDDGNMDLIVQDFSSVYGMDALSLYMVFANCGDGTYMQVGDGIFTHLKSNAVGKSGRWKSLQATRECFNESANSLQTRSFMLEFDVDTLTYGPPDGNLSLVEPCSSLEMMMPVESEEFMP